MSGSSRAEDVTEVLAALDRGEPDAAHRLFPLVYDELRALAAARMAGEPAGQTLQPTALVHEAYLRLLRPDAAGARFHNRAHFFGAAAEAMRRILIERARQRASLKRGGGLPRQSLLEDHPAQTDEPDPADLLALDAALRGLAALDGRLREIVMLRFFAGLTIEQTADATGLAARTVKRDWEFARAWLHREMDRDGGAVAAGGGVP